MTPAIIAAFDALVPRLSPDEAATLSAEIMCSGSARQDEEIVARWTATVEAREKEDGG